MEQKLLLLGFRNWGVPSVMNPSLASVISPPEQSILVVDDNELVRNLIVSIFDAAQIESLTAASGEEALELFRARGKEVGCALQDLSMPGMRGEEVIIELLKLERDLPIIVMSASDEAAIRRQLAHLPIADFLTKPFEAKVLVKKVRLLLTGATSEMD